LKFINSVGEYMLDVPTDSVMDRPLSEVLHFNAVANDNILEKYLEVLRTNKVHESEYCAGSGPLKGKCYQEQAVPLPDGIAISWRDITERKEAERMKSEFVSIVSHELRTPLTSIRGAVGLVLGDEENPISEDTREMLDIAYNNCERLVRLINDI